MNKLLIALALITGINVNVFADGEADYKNSTNTSLQILNSHMEQTTWGVLTNSWWEINTSHCDNGVCDYYFQDPYGEYIHIYNSNDSAGNNNGFWSDSSNGTHSNFSKGGTTCFEIKSTTIDQPYPSAADAAGTYWVDIYDC